MRKIKKRGALEVSVSAIIIMILALTFLSLGLIFIKTMIGKLFNKFEEQISTEPEPPKPSYSKFITLSRNPIKTNDDTVEVIKISVLNPTIRNWGQRQFIKTETLCGNLDGICFIDTTDQTGKCNSMETAKQNDVDCKVSTGKLECKDDGKKAPCLISNLEGDLYCPNPKNGDPNCQPVEGVEIYFYCEKELMKEVFIRQEFRCIWGRKKYRAN